MWNVNRHTSDSSDQPMTKIWWPLTLWQGTKKLTACPEFPEKRWRGWRVIQCNLSNEPLSTPYNKLCTVSSQISIISYFKHQGFCIKYCLYMQLNNIFTVNKYLVWNIQQVSLSQSKNTRKKICFGWMKKPDAQNIL